MLLALKNKRGESAGEWVVMMYHLLLVSFVGFIILGVSGVFYAHQVNIKDTESLLMARTIVDCVTKDGITKEETNEIKNQGLFTYCNIQGGELDRFFVRFVLKETSGEEITKIEQGDSGTLWIRKIFTESSTGSDSTVKKYTPGYTPKKSYDFFYEGRLIKMEIEVLLRHE
jgi:hypothetical protein